MPQFHTGFFSNDLSGDAAFFRGAGFICEKESGRFPGMPKSVKQHHKRLLRERGHPPGITYNRDGDMWFDGEIIIRATSQVAAKRAFNLFVASIAVCDGDIRWLPHPLEIERLAEKLSDSKLSDSEFKISRTGLTRACELAAKASRHRSSAYAIHKLHLSYRSCGVSGMDLQPSPHKLYSVENDPIAHVYIANAVTSAYSAIEELRLDIVVPQGKQSRMPDGSWNPEIKADLERRLRAAHIDLSGTCIWTLRGPPTRIERRRPPKGVGKPKWARGSVRDIELPIIDAIAMVSWLRSKISTHRFSSGAKSLTPYDAHNVQALARRLILERFRLVDMKPEEHYRTFHPISAPFKVRTRVDNSR
jgi:hypothetical protein